MRKAVSSYSHVRPIHPLELSKGSVWQRFRSSDESRLIMIAPPMADALAYSGWRKDGVLLFPARIVGRALELLFLAENQYDLSVVCADHCVVVHFWETQHQQADSEWACKQTCAVALLSAHVQLALSILRRLYKWVSGLGLAVKDAVVNTPRTEGKCHHDLVLKHAGEFANGQRYCMGIISIEVKVTWPNNLPYDISTTNGPTTSHTKSQQLMAQQHPMRNLNNEWPNNLPCDISTTNGSPTSHTKYHQPMAQQHPIRNLNN